MLLEFMTKEVQLMEITSCILEKYSLISKSHTKRAMERWSSQIQANR